jgi:alkylresorcinol/alkylpyrone synthase
MAIGTAVPPYKVKQTEMREHVRHLFANSFPNLDRYLSIFDHTEIESRYFSMPKEWFIKERTFSERNQLYIEMAEKLGVEAIRQCLQKTGISSNEIDHVFFVSTTGLATPSIDAHLFNLLEMNSHVKRTPIWGLGCAGGVAGLARAYEYVTAFPESRVILLALECCSLTFRPHDHSKSNLIATSLFADGAAAVLMVGDQADLPYPPYGPRIVSAQSTIWPETLEVMGWEIVDDGWKVVFSKEIPALVRRNMRPTVEEFLHKQEMELSQIDHVIFHPGGKKVLDAYQQSLGFKKDRFAHTYQVLKQYGNMSSATILFVLEQELQQSHRYGASGLMAALGPGFSAELLLIKWEEETIITRHQKC